MTSLPITNILNLVERLETKRRLLLKKTGWQRENFEVHKDSIAADFEAAADYVGDATSLVRALIDLNEKLAEVVTMLSKRQIATWYDASTAFGNGGYYAGWDDAEYAVKKVLEAYRATMGDQRND